MSQRSAPVCEKCELDKAASLGTEQQVVESDVATKACKEQYVAVSSCMKAHRGVISECRKEWDVFRECHGKAKPLR